MKQVIAICVLLGRPDDAGCFDALTTARYTKRQARGQNARSGTTRLLDQHETCVRSEQMGSSAHIIQGTSCSLPSDEDRQTTSVSEAGPHEARSDVVLR